MDDFDVDAFLAGPATNDGEFDVDAFLASGSDVEPLPKGPRTRGGKRNKPAPRRQEGPSLAIDRATGFREQVAQTGMTPEERAEAVRAGTQFAASMAAGPLLGGAIRAGSAIPGIRAMAPEATRIVNQFGRAVQSGGLGRDIPLLQRAAGAATAGAASAAVADPEAIEEGAALGLATPAVARVVRPFMAAKAPTTKELKKASEQAYANVEAAKADVGPERIAQLSYKIEDTLNRSGFNSVLHPKAQVAVNAFVEQAKTGQPITINQLDVLRRVAGRAAGSPSKDESRIGSALVRDIDDFIKEVAPEAVQRELLKARDLYARMSRSKVLERTIREATSGKGEPAVKIKEKFFKLANNDRAMRQFTEAEKDLIRKIGDGRFDISMLEGIGVLAAPPRLSEIRGGSFRSITPGLGYAGAFTGGGGLLGAGLVAATGYGSRIAANRLALARAQNLRALAASGVREQPLRPETFLQAGPAFLGGGSPEEMDMLAEQERINQLGF
jgi:hypothetical protein